MSVLMNQTPSAFLKEYFPRSSEISIGYPRDIQCWIEDISRDVHWISNWPSRRYLSLAKLNQHMASARIYFPFGWIKWIIFSYELMNSHILSGIYYIILLYFLWTKFIFANQSRLSNLHWTLWYHQFNIIWAISRTEYLDIYGISIGYRVLLGLPRLFTWINPHWCV